jgi:hypothetical protein
MTTQRPRLRGAFFARSPQSHCAGQNSQHCQPYNFIRTIPRGRTGFD